jgi:serine/threonine protein kinase
MLWNSNNRIKIAYFGVSDFVGKKKVLGNHEKELSKTAGSPAFFAPEVCQLEEYTNSSPLIKQKEPTKIMRMMLDTQYAPPVGAPIDIWAMGITLYCLLFGRVPFTGNSEFELFSKISTAQVTIPFECSDPCKNLLFGMLEKNPNQRIRMMEIRFHDWLTMDLTMEEKMTWLDETDANHVYAQPVHVSDEEVFKALSIPERLRKGIRKISSSLQNLGESSKQRDKKYNHPAGPVGLPFVMGYLPLSLEKKAKELALQTTLAPVQGATWSRWEPFE